MSGNVVYYPCNIGVMSVISDDVTQFARDEAYISLAKSTIGK